MEAPDHDDWSEFFALYRALAVRVATGLVGQPETAEDIVQEASRALVEHTRGGEAFESRAHARNWFLRAIRNLAISRLRARGRAGSVGLADETIADARAADPADVAGAAEATRAIEERVESALARLGEAEREALFLRYREGLAYREMATRTGAAISTLQARVESALKKIRNRVGKAPDGSNGGHGESPTARRSS